MIKKCLLVFAWLAMFVSPLFSQAPDQFDFQSLVRDEQGRFLGNRNVSIRVSIYQGNLSSPHVYRETGLVRTNQNGLLTWTIGKNTTFYDFSSIDWGKGPYYLTTEVDPNGGANFTLSTTTQLMSVPYALYANNTGHADTAKYAVKAGDYEQQIKELREMIENLRLRVSIYHPEGFSISPARQVKFHPQGNLTSSNENGDEPFRLVANQYTSGFPVFPSKGETAFIPEYAMTSNDYGVMAANANFIAPGWWTLSATQWSFLLYFRVHADQLWGKGKVNGIEGLILLPDGWEELRPTGIPFVPQTTNFTTNVYNITAWNQMQNAGAVFLPTNMSLRIPCNYYATSSIGPSTEGNNKIAVARLCIGASGVKPYISTESDIQGGRFFIWTIRPSKNAFVRLVQDF